MNVCKFSYDHFAVYNPTALINKSTNVAKISIVVTTQMLIFHQRLRHVTLPY